MAENYKPKKMVAIYEMDAKRMVCPNCHQTMKLSRLPEGTICICESEICRLCNVRYKVVKTLATIEKV